METYVTESSIQGELLNGESVSIRFTVGCMGTQVSISHVKGISKDYTIPELLKALGLEFTPAMREADNA